MSLHILAYNLKRLLTLLGIDRVMHAIGAYALFVSLKNLLRLPTSLTLPKVETAAQRAHPAFRDFQIGSYR